MASAADLIRLVPLLVEIFKRDAPREEKREATRVLKQEVAAIDKEQNDDLADLRRRIEEQSRAIVALTNKLARLEQRKPPTG